MRSSTMASVHIGEDDEAGASLYEHVGTVILRHATLFLYGATLEETKRVADSINAAIEGAKARAAAESEALAQAAQ